MATTISLSTLHPALASMKVAVRPLSEEDEAAVPPVDESYVFSEGLAKKLALWLAGGDGRPLWLYGPHGAGKTSAILQLAARLQKPVLVDNGSPDREAAEFIGMPALSGGETTTLYGSLVQAAKRGWWYVLNEADLLRPGVFAALNTVIEEGVITIPFSGEVIKPAPGFRLIVTANSAGRGDFDGRYMVEQQNAALMDRFIKVGVGYPEKAVEIDILTKQGVPEEVAEAFVNFANALRDLFQGKAVEVNGQTFNTELSVTLSTRSLVQLVKLIQPATRMGLPISECLDMVLGLDDPALEGEAEVVRSLWSLYVGDFGVSEAEDLRESA